MIFTIASSTNPVVKTTPTVTGSTSKKPAAAVGLAQELEAEPANCQEQSVAPDSFAR
jgi:hypothetical protein